VGRFGVAMRQRAQHRLSWLVAVSLAAGCSSAQLHQELVDSAAKVRVVSEAAAVADCKLLSAITAIGYTNRSGIVFGTGTPAITLLQASANGYGADTLELTSNSQSFRHGFVLTTLAGNAYSCGSPASDHQAAAENTDIPIPPHPSSAAEKGNATIRIRPTVYFLPSGKAQQATELPDWIAVDADIQGNHVLAYYDFTLQDERIPLEGCWLDSESIGQCRQRETDGAIALFDVDGRNLRLADSP
jgi:hypothetical protein